MKEHELKIGLEVHVQLNTKSKLFCGCSTYATQPNTSVCEICLGFPGSKPKLNKNVLYKAIKLGLALGCEIQLTTIFSRKTYFYPDMAKNFQITQYEKPICLNGFVNLEKKKIRIRRIQIEEDPASIKHEKQYSLIDYNRSGIPLCEIVTEPDFSSIEELIEFLDKLVAILDHIDIYDPKNFTLRVDVNVSIDDNSRVEIKNLSGSWAITKAVNFEVIRQLTLIRKGEKIDMQTMHFDAESGKTTVSRTKETEEDYGFIFDPDIPIIALSEEYIGTIKKELPELPDARIIRFTHEYDLSRYEASILVLEKATADLFENLKDINNDFVVKWIIGPLRKVLNYNNIKLSQAKVKTTQFKSLLSLMLEGKLTHRSGELVLRELIIRPDDLKKIIEKLNLKNFEDSEITKIIEDVFELNNKAIEDFKKGNSNSLNFLVGQVVNKTKGQADAKKVRDLIIEKLK